MVLDPQIQKMIESKKAPAKIIAPASQHERMLYMAYHDLIAFGKMFIDGDFGKSKSPPIHYQIGDELISPDTRPVAIIMARGHGKTTLVKTKIVRDFCFSKKAKEWGLTDIDYNHFYGWVSSNQRKSVNNVKFVALHLRSNKKIKYYFGDEISKFRQDKQEDIITGYNDRLLSSSNLTSMRGDTLATIDKGAVRYTSVFIDDAENEENTRTQHARDKIADNIMNGIYPAIEKNTPGARLFLIETPVHWDAFAQRIIDKHEKVKKEGQEALDAFGWKVFSYPATQPDMPGGVLWEDYMPRKKLDEMKKIYADSPKGIGGYYQEYELQVQSSENSLFTRDHIKYWEGYYSRRDETNFVVIDGEHIPINTFIGCDPATDIETKDSDFSVVMCIGVDANNNIYVLDYERHRGIPTLGLRGKDGQVDGKKGVVDYIIEMYDKYHCKSGVVEDVAMNRTIFQDLNRVKKDRNRFNINIIPEKPGGRNKHNRIYSGLNSRFASGAIYVKEAQYELINEIIKFGAKMAHDDTIETLYYSTLYAYPYQGSQGVGMHAQIGKPRRRRKKNWLLM